MKRKSKLTLGTVQVTFLLSLVWFGLLYLTPLSAIFQLYHGDQF